MRTLESIQQEISALGNVDLFGTKKEVECLPEILLDDERILYLTSGLMDGTTWLIVCTNERVILLDKGLLFGLKHVDFPLDKINSVSYRTGLIFGEILIWHGGAQMKIENCMKETVKPFTDTLNQAMKDFTNRQTAQTAAPQPVQAGAPAVDVASQLEKLAALMEKGILTKEEFDAQKKKLLESF